MTRPDAELVVAWRDRYYAIVPDDGYAWNRKAFSLPFQFFRMSMSAGSNTGPAVTIAK